MPRPLHSGRAASAALVLSLVAALALAGCGGSGSPGSPGTGTSSVAAAGLKYATCVRAHGVPDFPDPVLSTGTRTAAAPPAPSEPAAVVQKAENACQRYAEAVLGPPLSSGQIARLKAGALAYAKCVRAHGVPDFPDPTVETGPGGRGAGITPPFGSGASARAHDTPAVQAAIRTCGPLVDKVMPGLESSHNAPGSG